MLLSLPFRVRSALRKTHRPHISFLTSRAAHVGSRTMAPSREVIEIEDSSEYDDEDAFSPELLNLDDFDNGELGYGVDPAYYGFGDNGDAPIRQNFVPDLPTQQAPSFEECLGRVVEVYPDICHDHIRQLYDTQVLAFVPQAGLSPQDQISQLLILQILDTDKYPKESDRRKELKRKRSVTLDSDEEDAATWTAVERAAYPDEYSKQASVFPSLGISHRIVMVAFTLFIQLVALMSE